MESNRSKEGIHQLATLAVQVVAVSACCGRWLAPSERFRGLPSCVVNMCQYVQALRSAAVNLQGVFVVYVTTSNRE